MAASNPNSRARRIGVILAGGESRRFGSDKAVALWRGRPLIAWARDAIAAWCGMVYVNGREWGELPSLPDQPRAGLGPLGGIAAGLAQGLADGCDTVLTIACDMPDVPATVLRALCQEAPQYCLDAPVLGHWPVAHGAALIAALETGRVARVGEWARSIGARPVPATLLNVNWPEDLPQ